MAATETAPADRPHHPVSATIQGALALAAVAAIGDTADLSPLWGGAVAAAGALGTVLAGAHHNHGPASLLYRLSRWVIGGGWLTYTLATTPWSSTAWAGLAVGTLAAGLTAQLGRPTPRPATPRTGTALVLRSSARLGAEWEARIRRVCQVEVTVTDVTTWPNGCGYDVYLTLPPSGVTRAALATRAEGLATAADLPEGCSVDVRGVEGQGRSRVVLRVSTISRLGQTIGYPADYSPRSILEPIILGEHSNSDPAGAVVREEAGLFSGKRGSGKTTLLQGVSIALGRCRDNLTWHLDLNGGGLTQPWVDVWLDGRVRRCPVDWAAPNLAEGKVMLAAAIAIAKHRKASYRKLKRAHNTNLLPVSADLPQITIVVDEGANAVTDRDLRELIGELQNIGRNEAVNLIISSLRPTGDLVPVNMRKQSGVRIQMHGPDPEELAHMFGWGASGKLSMDQLAGKGTGFISVDGSTPRPFRGYNVLPQQVEEAALAIASLRPDLDAASAEAAGPAYATRYDRMREAFAEHDDETETGAAVEPRPDPPVPAPRLTVLTGGADASTWADPLTLARRTRPATPDTPSSPPCPAEPRPRLVAEQIHQIPAPSVAVPELLQRALEAFGDDDRIHSATLAERLGADQVELTELLRAIGVRTLPRAFMRGGEERRGYARTDLETAADAIRSGDLAVPPEVADWPAA